MMLELIIGIIGMLFILVAFVLEEFDRKFNPETLIYNSFNILGSGMLIYYGIMIKGWPFVFLNTVWCLAAVVKLGKILWKRFKLRF